MKNEKVITEHYMEQFRCIGGKCEDTCCAGWYIAVDEATYNKYKKVKDPIMKKRLSKELVLKKERGIEHVAKIKLKNNRCAFLSKEGWCDLYTNLGEGYLSETCTLYPRTINQIGEHLEYSLALSCPEAARLILLGKEPIRWKKDVVAQSDKIVISGKLQVDSKKPKSYRDYFKELREILLNIMQNRSFSIEERIAFIEQFLKDVHERSGPAHVKSLPKLIAMYNAAGYKKMRPTPPNMKEESKAALLLLGELRELRKIKKWPSARYEECYEKLVLSVIDAKSYETGYNKYYISFLKENDHMLENYFVNYIFERLVPLDGVTPLESAKKLKAYYSLLKLHLIGIGMHEEGITKEAVVKLIQSFTKVFDHNELYMNRVLKLK